MTHYARGDTIIEVMLAFAIFAMLAVGALTVMNKGTASAEDSLETTLVRQQVDNQAETLRFLHQAYLADANNTVSGSLPDEFLSIVNFATTAGLTQPSKFGAPCTATIPGGPSNRFVLAPDGSMITSANVKAANAINTTITPPYAQVTTIGGTVSSYGMWVEPVVSDDTVASGTARYIDFHIRACWDSAVNSNQRTLGTVVRLYVPANVNTGTVGARETPISTPPTGYYTVAGGSATKCYPHKDLERGDAENAPDVAWGGPFAFYVGDPDLADGSRGVTFTPNPSYACKTPSAPGGSIWSCSNYDAEFNSPVLASDRGVYDIVFNYADFACGGLPVVSSYNFEVNVYVNNNFRNSADLSISASTSSAIDIGQLNDGDLVQIRWWNNHFFGTGSPNPYEDPDLIINSLTFKRTS